MAGIRDDIRPPRGRVAWNFSPTCPATQESELMSNLWLILVPVILIVALILFFRLTKKL